jgi:DmsE family decaheme c-type cytochrome
MEEPVRRARLFWAVAKLGAVTVLLGFSASAQSAPQAGAVSSQPPSQNESSTKSGSGYVGSDTCKTCHDELYTKDFEFTPHWQTTLDTRRGPAFQGCEACHGPGQAHVAAGGDPTKIFSFKQVSAEQINGRCLECHQYSREHSNFARSAHAANNVSCIDCHSPHHFVDKEFLLVKRQPQLCYGCHADREADFSRPFHHRVNEGLVKCSDCHNEHGGFLTAQLRSVPSQDAVCYKCHTDKLGPFVFEHVPVKTEGCTICHMPHGSNNPRLLKVYPVNLVCLGCHSPTMNNPVPGAPTFHNQNTRYSQCNLCHVQIHGSNLNEFFFK